MSHAVSRSILVHGMLLQDYVIELPDTFMFATILCEVVKLVIEGRKALGKSNEMNTVDYSSGFKLKIIAFMFKRSFFKI